VTSCLAAAPASRSPFRLSLGAVWAPGGRPRIAFGFTITRGKIVEIELIADPERLGRLDLATATD
jgi:hypothetical protein